MAYSTVQYEGDGSNELFAVPFQYLDKAHVQALVGGVAITFSWLTDSTVRITPAPKGRVEIRRVTPKVQSPVDFSDGSVLKEKDLDTLALFGLFCAQESQDLSERAIQQSSLGIALGLIYQGSLTSAPTIRTNGQPLSLGDLYYDSREDTLKVWTGALWQAAGATVPGVVKKPAAPVVAAAGQIAVPVPGGFDPNGIIVFLNGVQVGSPDVDVSSGATITFSSALSAGDEVSWVAFGIFQVSALSTATGSSQVGFTQGGTNSAVRTIRDKSREIVSLEDFGAVGDGVVDDSSAAAAASLYCFQTGATLRLQGKVYKGARIEVHGTFSVEGNGATVDYLGIGTTLIAGVGTGTSSVPSAWPNDPAYDPSGLFNPVMFNIGAAVTVGAQAITLSDTTGLAPGMLLFLAGSPTSASSTGNYIPRDFEFVRIKSISGSSVTLTGRVKNSYGIGAAAFYSKGNAVNCRVSDLRIATSNDAYQIVIRSSYHCSLDNIEFAGQSAVGAWTFSERLHLTNLKAVGAYGPISSARGTVSVVLDGFEWSPRTGATGEDCAVFIEESFYSLDLSNIRSNGGYYSIRQLDMTGAQTKRTVAVRDSVFDTRNAVNGPTAPMQSGNAAGCDQYFDRVNFYGQAVTPLAGVFPGISGTALTFIASNQVSDQVKFNTCHFASANSGEAFKTGSGALGPITFDDLTSFETVFLASKYQRGAAWTTFPVLGPATNSSANTGYSKRDNVVRLRGGVTLNSLTTGANMGALPLGYRPPVDMYFPVSCVGTGGAYFTVGQIGISTSGLVTWQASERASVAAQLDSVSFSVN